MILTILGLLCAGTAPVPPAERPVLLQETQKVDEATRKKIDKFCPIFISLGFQIVWNLYFIPRSS